MVLNGGWSFDIGSFMILVGEQQEFDYRLMHRCILECLNAAPVAGLQSYLRSFATLRDAQGPNYISPYGCKTAPLRNARLAQTLNSKHLLEDGRCTVYKVAAGSNESRSTTLFSYLLI